MMTPSRALKFGFVLLNVSCIAAAQQASVPTPDEVRQQFAAPAKMYRPLVRWWWPGNDVTPAELEREVGALDAAGFGGAEIQPFRIGLPKLSAEAEKRVNDYPSPNFFRNVAAAAKAAREHGMFVDYTFGSGWPFGGPHITPELASVELRWSHMSVMGPETLHTRLDLPGLYEGDPRAAAGLTRGLPEGWAKRLEDRVKLVGVVALRGEDAQWYQNQGGVSDRLVLKSGMLDPKSAVDLTGHLQADGTLDWEVPPGTWQVFVFRSAPTVHKLLGGVGEGPQLEMDHWSLAAFNAHAKAVGDAGVPEMQPYFGNGLRAIFCDSLEVKENVYWSDDFMAEFRKRRGYELLPYLPILKVQGYGGPFSNFDNLPAYDVAGVGDAVRRDYWQTISDLMMERFFDPFNKWAHDHKLLARTQSHGAPADVLKIYGEADIPETEQLYDEGRYDFLKEASSSAHVYGRNIVGSESFVWRLNVYQNTPERMKAGADELLTAGVNAILYHGFAYQVAGLADPGWHPFAGAPTRNSHAEQFNEKNPLWPYFRPLNEYMTRVQYLSQVGTNVAQVALYHYELQHGSKEPPAPTPALQQALMDAGYNYDHINEESIEKSTVAGHQLVTAGGAHYDALAFPAERQMSGELAAAVSKLAAQGLPVLFVGEAPSQANTLTNAAVENQQLHAAMQAMARAKSVRRVADAAQAVVEMRRVAAPAVRFQGVAYPYLETKIGGMTAYFLRNASDEEKQVTAEFSAEGTPELWDPWTGRSNKLGDVMQRGGVTTVHVTLQPIGSALIVFTPKPMATEVMRTTHIARIEPVGASGWKLTATGMMPTGKQGTFTRSVQELQSWIFDADLKGLAGHGTYTTTFAKPAANGRVMLSLGRVGDVAEVKVNGKPAGTLLMRPYTVDVTELLQPGENSLAITVTNTMYNSMLLREPRTHGAGKTYTPSGLMPSGLMGPVQLEILQ